jgi:hypothetical protein
MWTRANQIALIGMALVLSAAVEAAPLVNGGFETGDLTGWSWGPAPTPQNPFVNGFIGGRSRSSAALPYHYWSALDFERR